MMARSAAALVVASLLATCTLPGAMAATATGTLGSGVSVAANTETTITYAVGGCSLVVKLDSAATVTLSTYATAAVSTPPGYSSLGLTIGVSTGVGFTLAVSGSAKILKAELTTPPLTAAAAAVITGTVEVGCLRLDTSANAYTAVDIKSYTTGTKKVVVDLPMAATYVFASFDASASAAVPVPTLFGESRACSSSESRVYGFPGGLSIKVKSTTSNSIRVFRNSSSDRMPASGTVAAGAFLDIRLATEEAVDAVIKTSYDASALATLKVAPSSLEFRYWAKAEAVWMTPPAPAVVDVQAKTVAQAVTHFSEWGLYGQKDSKDSKAAASFSGEWLSPTTTSRCHRLEGYSHTLGVLNFDLTKTSSTGGELMLYVNKGTTCPTASSSDTEKSPKKAEAQNDKANVCLTSETNPKAETATYSIGVFVSGTKSLTENTQYSLEVSNKLACPDNAGAATQMASMAALLLVAAVAVVVGL
mmetsp:Transcript_12853/g.35247  ORF Transcript_12853/g.35247 Transcript_12853/m.35247 type:complete len:475 (-) Transcript_12853:163-1587(-)